jgi:hypothetical protein
MVGKTFSAVTKLDYMFDSPKTGLFIPGKDKLAKYMVCVTIFLHVRDHYFVINYDLSVFRRDKMNTHDISLISFE